MYLHPEMETLTRPEIERLQLERLQKRFASVCALLSINDGSTK